MSPTLLTPPVVDDATRRQFLTGLTVAGLLAGCGSDPAPAEPAAPSTRTITNEFGTFEVPTDPQRVVGLEGRRDLETAIALGLGIVAVGSNAVYAERGTDELAPFINFDLDSVTVLDQAEVNLEQLAALRPDLILTAAATSRSCATSWPG